MARALLAEGDPANPMTQVYLAQLANLRKNPELAERLYRKATTVGSPGWAPHSEFGVFLFRQARFEDALREFERARELAPDHPTVYQNLGGVYHRLDRADEAASAYQRALELRPTPATYGNLGTLYFYQGKQVDAVKAFDNSLKLRSTNYLQWGNYGDACRWSIPDRAKAGEAYATALKLGREQLAKTPGDLDVRSSLDTYLVKSGDKEAAVAETAAIEKSAPAKTNPSTRSAGQNRPGDLSRLLAQSLCSGASTTLIGSERKPPSRA